MTRITRYGREMRTTFIATMFIACLVIVIGIPFVSKQMFDNEVGYYSISIQGNYIGAANTEDEVNVALADARLQLCKEFADYIYMDCDVKITKQRRAIAKRMTTKQLQNAIYSSLFDCIVDVETQLAYTVRVDDNMVTLATKEEVEELFRKIIQPYNVADEFEPVIKAGTSIDEQYTIAINKNEEESVQDTQIVASFFEDNKSENGTNKKSPDQLMGIDFAENVSVNAVSGDKADVVSVQEAYDILTRENKSQVSYIIKEGDTLEQIAKDYQMTLDDLLKLNDIASQNVVVVPGDELVVTVPDTQITVLTTKQLSYDEDYKAEVSYIDDNNNSRGTNTILDEGTSGKRTVVANVTYANGREVARDIVKENITEESKPEKIAVGTLTHTDYIKPVAGTFVSGYGTGEDTVNYGVDWMCSEGITVVAARAGKVTRAGWYGGYGYCVDIQHEDGSLTRYANNSRLTVSVGEQVSQGQQIALSGSTGDVTSPRLHFEIWIDGTRVNPLNYVNKN